MTATATTGSAGVQGRLWGARSDDWAGIQEGQAQPVYDEVIRRLPVGRGARVLDAGCGSGVFAATAAAAGARVHGLDASEALIGIARRRVPDGEFAVGELEVLPYDDDAFDVVTGFNSFQYAARAERALAEAARVTAPGGRVVGVVWGREEDCEAAAYVAALGSFLPPPPPGARGPFALSADCALEELLRGAGLTPIETVDVPAAWEYADEATAMRGMLSAGPAVRAIESAGEEPVATAALAAIAPYRSGDGGYRLENVFRCVVAAV